MANYVILSFHRNKLKWVPNWGTNNQLSFIRNATMIDATLIFQQRCKTAKNIKMLVEYTKPGKYGQIISQLSPIYDYELLATELMDELQPKLEAWLREHNLDHGTPYQTSLQLHRALSNTLYHQIYPDTLAQLVEPSVYIDPSDVTKKTWFVAHHPLIEKAIVPFGIKESELFKVEFNSKYQRFESQLVPWTHDLLSSLNLAFPRVSSGIILSDPKLKYSWVHPLIGYIKSFSTFEEALSVASAKG